MSKWRGIFLGSLVSFLVVVGISSVVKGWLPKLGTSAPKSVHAVLDLDERKDIRWQHLKFNVTIPFHQTLPDFTVGQGDTLVIQTFFDNKVDAAWIGDMVPGKHSEHDYVSPAGVKMRADRFFPFINYPGKLYFPREPGCVLLAAIGTLLEDELSVNTVDGRYFVVGYGTKRIVPEGVGGPVHLRMNIPRRTNGWVRCAGFWQVRYAKLPAGR